MSEHIACIYCPLCGAFFERMKLGRQPTAWNSAWDRDRPSDWHEELRLVRSRKGSSPYVTGVGFLLEVTQHTVLFAPPDATKWRDLDDLSIANCQFSILRPANYEAFPVFRPYDSFWAFPIHDACWNLLKSCTSVSGHDGSTLAPSLFNFLISLDIRPEQHLEPKSIYGIDPKCLDESLVLSKMATKWKTVHANPCELSVLDNLPTIDNLIKQYESAKSPGWRRGRSSTQRHLRITQTTSDSSDAFYHLPPELLHMILLLLPSKDVCALRLASPSVANSTRPQELPQAFWRSKFLPESEMGFAYPEGDIRPFEINWFHRYLAVKKACSSRTKYHPLKNRRRIWKVIMEISETFEKCNTRRGDHMVLPNFKWIPQLEYLLRIGSTL
ncbi:hypothetical protein BU16DRAFT_561002 [Lophium mytilinum]|uniref:F-box domain-containing protein n=1 Tax=Lophium mytilinum TaxID=390894 RepID=A0A6A6QUH9_9PEZI|nr:hypothetical protein BU16DRAFT_561002 [Lophium mytilinum]